MHDGGLNLTNMHKWSNLAISILWVLMGAVMCLCLIAGIMSGNPLLICVALFACSMDGINAYTHFRTYLTYRKLIHEIKTAGENLDEK